MELLVKPQTSTHSSSCVCFIQFLSGGPEEHSKTLHCFGVGPLLPIFPFKRQFFSFKRPILKRPNSEKLLTTLFTSGHLQLPWKMVSVVGEMTFSKLGGDWLLYSVTVGDPPKNQYWLSYRCRTAAIRSRDGAVILLEVDIYVHPIAMTTFTNFTNTTTITI